MKIDVRGSTVPISYALEEHIRRRLAFALRRFAGKVERVVVRLVDLNGPKGGPDKRCRISAQLMTHGPTVMVEATSADAYLSVSQAAARLDERVARTLARQRDWTAPSRHALRRWQRQPRAPEAPDESA